MIGLANIYILIVVIIFIFEMFTKDNFSAWSNVRPGIFLGFGEQRRSVVLFHSYFPCVIFVIYFIFVLFHFHFHIFHHYDSITFLFSCSFTFYQPNSKYNLLTHSLIISVQVWLLNGSALWPQSEDGNPASF